ncbi:hypothetical protein [Streptomyces chiangmaiensis]|uniref:Integral membrane protein n=1 Tax=Streptomyces chiangmaiensis TaxID=766497 RepID=A0ABU7FFQ3_9ACTN|nr:hypothetical protein [Streptomyces chiangmaiensis]MED7822966.1 hypothetical protein [Streptomyces chiangmaiensis]
MIDAREVSDALVLARAAGTILAGIGGVSFIFFILGLGLARRDEAEGKAETAKTVRRNAFIAGALAVLLIGGDFAIWAL